VTARLSRDEAWRVLAASHTGILTTLRADGAPISLPVWFAVLDERVYVGAPAATRKVGRVRRDSRVSFLVESGERWADLQGVHLTGHALVVDDPTVIARVRAALDAKYASYRTARAEMPDATRRVYEAPIAIVEIRPDDRILSWDNALQK
jgi:PPOX class probable F420-dependent enzyme